MKEEKRNPTFVNKINELIAMAFLELLTFFE